MRANRVRVRARAFVRSFVRSLSLSTIVLCALLVARVVTRPSQRRLLVVVFSGRLTSLVQTCPDLSSLVSAFACDRTHLHASDLLSHMIVVCSPRGIACSRRPFGASSAMSSLFSPARW